MSDRGVALRRRLDVRRRVVEQASAPRRESPTSGDVGAPVRLKRPIVVDGGEAPLWARPKRDQRRWLRASAPLSARRRRGAADVA